ncbi:hypothetical protein D8674_034912 [Pyrus ussuriensis x Pyrus communis]|uniref:Uncharacterized protein n=1 Tax=Pyrus ussuriensis x Pyrus communis TaxID=2448454 RepID=A0A5N5GB07_9ROSA|nr:hypothetical protein D8674_034912 [Pyrus ussuriensis x Pyrus communis]
MLSWYPELSVHCDSMNVLGLHDFVLPSEFLGSFAGNSIYQDSTFGHSSVKIQPLGITRNLFFVNKYVDFS